MATQTSQNKLGDLLKMELDHRYTRLSCKVKAGDGIDGNVPENLLGYPVVVDANDEITFVTSAGAGFSAADANGLVLLQGKQGSTALADLPDQIPVLRRGPALVNEDQIIVTDYNGVALTLATLVTALADENIRTLKEHAQTTEQTT